MSEKRFDVLWCVQYLFTGRRLLENKENTLQSHVVVLFTGRYPQYISKILRKIPFLLAKSLETV